MHQLASQSKQLRGYPLHIAECCVTAFIFSFFYFSFVLQPWLTLVHSLEVPAVNNTFLLLSLPHPSVPLTVSL